MIDELRALRDDLHARAYEAHTHGLSESAQTLWAVVESLDTILTDRSNGDAP